MTEHEFIQCVNLIATNHNSRLVGIDFQARWIQLEGPKTQQVKCARAISEFMDTIEEITELPDDNTITRLTDNLSIAL